MEEITPILAGLQKLKVPAVGGDHAILAGLQKLRVPAVVLNLCCYHHMPCILSHMSIYS